MRSTILAVALVACSPSAPLVEGDRAPAQPASIETGRFVIVHSPHIQRDTILLDTVTGKTWLQTELTDREGNPVVWWPMARMDEEGEIARLRIEAPAKASSKGAAPE